MFAVRIAQFFRALLRWLVPSCIVIFGICLEHVPLPGSLTFALVPYFSILLIIGFSIRKASIMPPWLVFCLLLVAELYVGAVPGTIVIPGLVVRYILMVQREFFLFAPFFAVWMGASFLVLIFMSLHWMAVVGFHLHLFDPTAGFIRALASIAIYPVTAVVVYGTCLLLWPVRSVDQRLDDRQVQFLRMGFEMPAVVRRDKTVADHADAGDDATGTRARGRDEIKRRRIRRIGATKPRKRWMEL